MVVSSGGDADRSKADRELAASNVNRTWPLVGSSTAIFTFLLFFLYPRFSSGQIDPILFQVTLTVVVLSIFSFSFSAVYYYRISLLKMSDTEEHASMQRGTILWVLGTLFVASEPALILFTVGLTVVALVATSLWLLFTSLIVRQFRQLSNR